MSFPRYPKYKDSGVEWLGEVPEHWIVGPIKRLIQKVESGTSVNASDEPAEDGKLGVLKTSCVYSGTFEPDENKTVLEEDIRRVSCPLKSGTLIVSRMNTPDLIGAAGLVTQARANLFLPDRLWQISFLNADACFVHFWTLTSLYRGQVKAVCTGTSSSMKNLGQDQFGNFSFAAPPITEQSHIATFLDRETAKIDGLVEEQRRLMELLKEKRQAVISHAVTKGLNPDAPMKPSGIEWFGDVPEHWEVTRLGWVCSTINDINHEMPVAVESGVPFLSAKDLLDDGTLNFTDDIKQISEEDYVRLSKKICPCRGDIIYSRIGACLGKARLVETDARFSVSYSCCVVRVMETIASRRFIQHLLDGEMILTEARIRTQGIGVPDLGLREIGRFPLPLPPMLEQEAIAGFLEVETSRFDALTAEAQHAIDLLLERRTALISAAVTGQIDVRQYNGRQTA